MYVGLSYIFLGQMFIQIPCPLFNFIVCCHWVVWGFMFWILILYQTHGLQISFPIPSVVFSLGWWFLLPCKSFFVWCSPTCLFFILFLCFMCQKKSIYKSLLQDPCQGALFLSFLLGISLFQVLHLSLIHFKLIFASGVRYELSSILLNVNMQSSQHHWLKRLSFHHGAFLAPLSDISWPHKLGCILGSQCSSIHLFLCQYYNILVTIAFYYILKSGTEILPALVFFLRISLATWGLWSFHINFRSIISISVKIAIRNLIVIPMNL